MDIHAPRFPIPWCFQMSWLPSQQYARLRNYMSEEHAEQNTEDQLQTFVIQTQYLAEWEVSMP
jgi:hypothetical protein